MLALAVVWQGNVCDSVGTERAVLCPTDQGQDGALLTDRLIHSLHLAYQGEPCRCDRALILRQTPT